MSLFSIFVDLRANTADFVSGMSGASYASKKAAREIQESFGNLGGLAEKALAPLGAVGEAVGSSLAAIADAAGAAGSKLATLGSVSIGGALAGIAGTAIAAGAAMSGLAIKGAEVVENFERISQKTGISIQDLQVFGAAGQSVGVSLDDVVAGIRKFDQVLTDTGRGTGQYQGALKFLGITATDNKNALLQLADAFSQMEDGPRKAAMAVELLGRSGLNLIPILDKGRAGIEHFQEIVSTFGPTISSRAIAATDEWTTSTLELSQAWDKVEVTLTENFLPAITQVAKALAADLADQGLVSAIKNLGVIAGGTIGVIDTLWDGVDQVWSAGVLDLEELERSLVMVYAAGADAIVGHFRQAWQDIKAGASDLNDYFKKYEADESKRWSDNRKFINGLGLPGSEASGSEGAFGSPGVPSKPRSADEDSYKNIYERLAAGGKEQLALQQAELKLAGDVGNQLWKEAAADEARIFSLKQIVELEQERAKIQDDFNRKLGIGELNISHPTLPGRASFAGPTADQVKALPSFSTLFGYATPEQVDQNRSGAGSTDQNANVAAFSSAANDFWKQYGDGASNTFKQIADSYVTSYNNFYDLLQEELADDGAANKDKADAQTQFNSISLQLEKNRIASIAALDRGQMQDPFSSVGDKFRSLASEMQIEGQNLGPKLFASMSTAVDGFEDQLAKLVVTGKANFRQLFDSFAESAAKAEFQNVFGNLAGLFAGKNRSLVPPAMFANAPGGTPGIVSGSLGIGAAATHGGVAGEVFGTIGKIFGVGKKTGPGGAPDGSQASPFYVVSSGAAGAPGALPASGFNFGGLNALFGGSGSSSGGGFFSSVFHGITSIFGGGLAGGGDMDPGKAYLVGEKGPELMFAGSRGGSIAPLSAKSGSGGGGHTINMHINGVSDVDSFKHSSSQIMAQMHRQLEIARARS